MFYLFVIDTNVQLGNDLQRRKLSQGTMMLGLVLSKNMVEKALKKLMRLFLQRETGAARSTPTVVLGALVRSHPYKIE